ncbi:DUF779 domain-containing protein [Noviherbaspirillum album]|nr:DUF779 domain-containing protein [Noviherbaspirillum sp. CPCC 100848]
MDHINFRVVASYNARDVILKMRNSFTGLMYFRYDGILTQTASLYVSISDFGVLESDIFLGAIDGIPFFMSEYDHHVLNPVKVYIDVAKPAPNMLSNKRLPNRALACFEVTSAPQLPE